MDIPEATGPFCFSRKHRTVNRPFNSLQTHKRRVVTSWKMVRTVFDQRKGLLGGDFFRGIWQKQVSTKDIKSISKLVKMLDMEKWPPNYQNTRFGMIFLGSPKLYQIHSLGKVDAVSPLPFNDIFMFHVPSFCLGAIGWHHFLKTKSMNLHFGSLGGEVSHPFLTNFFLGGVCTGEHDESAKNIPTFLLLLMAEILHQLMGSLSHCLQGFIHPRWLFGISEPSTVSRGFAKGHDANGKKWNKN